MKKGFTLIEIMIAVFIMTFGIVSIYSLIVSVIQMTTNSAERFIAGQLSREGIELVRNRRDQNWMQEAEFSLGLFSCSSGCERDFNDVDFINYGDRFLKINTNGFYNYDSGENTIFKRRVTITPQIDYLEVKVEVLWKDSSFVVRENIYDWE